MQLVYGDDCHRSDSRCCSGRRLVHFRLCVSISITSDDKLLWKQTRAASGGTKPPEFTQLKRASHRCQSDQLALVKELGYGLATVVYFPFHCQRVTLHDNKMTRQQGV